MLIVADHVIVKPHDRLVWSGDLPDLVLDQTLLIEIVAILEHLAYCVQQEKGTLACAWVLI